jgi:hypothetical protein
MAEITLSDQNRSDDIRKGLKVYNMNDNLRDYRTN